MRKYSFSKLLVKVIIKTLSQTTNIKALKH